MFDISSNQAWFTANGENSDAVVSVVSPCYLSLLAYEPNQKLNASLIVVLIHMPKQHKYGSLSYAKVPSSTLGWDNDFWISMSLFLAEH